MIRRRHVFYVEGYDPQGAAGYYGVFQREIRRFRKTWSVDATIGDLVIDNDDVAHWTIETTGSSWQVATRYEFLRLESFITANMTQPMPVQLFRAVRWMISDLASGATVRMIRASWRFALHVLYMQALLLAWIAVAIAGGWIAGFAAAKLLDAPAAVAIAVATAFGIAIFAGLRLLANRWFVLQVTNGWPYLREFARGRPTGYDGPIEALARRIVTATRANEVDEILIVGHSAGGAICPAIMARALELDADLGRHGPSVVLMTAGSLLPAFALHPKADLLRRSMRRIAIEPAVLWVDCQARKDVMNFHDFDPVEGVGIHLGPERVNPLIWQVRFRDMLTDESYKRRRANYFRMHYQFILGNDRRAPYDYFVLTCGPLPVADWVNRGDELVWTFEKDVNSAQASIVGTAQT